MGQQQAIGQQQAQVSARDGAMGQQQARRTARHGHRGRGSGGRSTHLAVDVGDGRGVGAAASREREGGRVPAAAHATPSLEWCTVHRTHGDRRARCAARSCRVGGLAGNPQRWPILWEFLYESLPVYQLVSCECVDCNLQQSPKLSECLYESLQVHQLVSCGGLVVNPQRWPIL